MRPGFTIYNDLQGSDDWLQARLGRLTGSRAKDMLATIKSGGEAAKRADLRLQLVTERITGRPQGSTFVNDEMVWGVRYEPEAREVYEAVTGLSVRQTGFLARLDCMAGCSLDGDVDNFTGIQEFKVPKSTTHLRTLRLGMLPSEHAPQVTHNLWCTGAEWCDFASYDPRMPFELQLFVVRVKAKDINLEAYDGLVRAFLKEVDEEEAELRERMAKAVEREWTG